MQVFFSYGHDQNAPVVELLRQDLESAKFSVWIDKSDLKSGDDWRREIARAILQSDVVFSFASSYSLRRPGVCIDELSIAVGVKGALVQTILLESDVQPPASTMFRNIVDMSDWVDHVRDPSFLDWHNDWCGRLKGSDGAMRKRVFEESGDPRVVEALRCDSAFGDWYGPLLQQLLGILDDPTSQRFAEEVRELRMVMAPDELNIRQRTLEREEYSGRAWLRGVVDGWLADETAPKVLLITGNPGVGKSSFVAHELLFNELVGAAVYCEWNNPASNSPDRVAMSVAYQLACRYPDYRLLLMDVLRKEKARRGAHLPPSSKSAFERYVIGLLPNAIDGSRPTLLILIDGIDELERPGQHIREGESLAGKISSYAQLLPDWVRFVVTCRNSSAALEYLRGARRIDIDHKGEKNLADVREYIARRLEGSVDQAAVSRILLSSDGVFLHATLICDELAHGWITVDDIPSVPQGLGVVYRRYFDRMFSDADGPGYGAAAGCFEAMSALVVSAEPVPGNTLKVVAGWGDPELASFCERCGHFLDTSCGNLTFRHKSLSDWLQSPLAKAYQVDGGVGWRALASACYTAYDNGLARMNEFELFNIIRFVDEARMSCLAGTDERQRLSRTTELLLSDRKLGERLIEEGTERLPARQYALVESCARDAIRVFSARLHLEGECDHTSDVQKLGEGYELLAEAVDLSVRLGDAIACCDEGIDALRDAGILLGDGNLDVGEGIARLTRKRAYVYYRMGDHFKDAEKGFRKSCEWFAHAGYAREAAEAIMLLGAAYRLDGNDRMSLECARQIGEVINLDECKRDDPPFYCSVQIYQGDFHLNAGEFERAKACLLDAAEVADRLGDELPLSQKAQLHLQLSSLYYRTGEYEQGEMHGKESLRLEEEAYGAKSVESCNGMNQVGWCLLRQGKPEEALSQFEESYRIRQRTYGDENPFTALSLRNCAMAHAGMGGRWLEVARIELEKVLEVRRRLIAGEPGRQGRIADTLRDLGRVSLREGSPESAEVALPYICEAERVYKELPQGPNVRGVASCLELRGDALSLRGDRGGARACYEEALRLFQEVLGQDSEHHSVLHLREILRGM